MLSNVDLINDVCRNCLVKGNYEERIELHFASLHADVMKINADIIEKFFWKVYSRLDLKPSQR